MNLIRTRLLIESLPAGRPMNFHAVVMGKGKSTGYHFNAPSHAAAAQQAFSHHGTASSDPHAVSSIHISHASDQSKTSGVKKVTPNPMARYSSSHKEFKINNSDRPVPTGKRVLPPNVPGLKS